MTTVRIALALAALPLIVTACALDEDEPTRSQLDEAEATVSETAAIEANARLEAQAAAGNRDAQQVLQGMARFRRTVPRARGGQHSFTRRTGHRIAAARADRRKRSLQPGRCVTPNGGPCVTAKSSILLKVASDGFAEVSPLLPNEGGRQLFVFCRDNLWSSNHHLIWANAGGYLRPNPNFFWAVGLASGPVNETFLFDIQNLDGTWSYFDSVSGGYAQPDFAAEWGGLLFADPFDPLNGNALWRCTPGRCTDRFGRP